MGGTSWLKAVGGSNIMNCPQARRDQSPGRRRHPSRAFEEGRCHCQSPRCRRRWLPTGGCPHQTTGNVPCYSWMVVREGASLFFASKRPGSMHASQGWDEAVQVPWKVLVAASERARERAMRAANADRDGQPRDVPQDRRVGLQRTGGVEHTLPELRKVEAVVGPDRFQRRAPTANGHTKHTSARAFKTASAPIRVQTRASTAGASTTGPETGPNNRPQQPAPTTGPVPTLNNRSQQPALTPAPTTGPIPGLNNRPHPLTCLTWHRRGPGGTRLAAADPTAPRQRRRSAASWLVPAACLTTAGSWARRGTPTAVASCRWSSAGAARRHAGASPRPRADAAASSDPGRTRSRQRAPPAPLAAGRGVVGWTTASAPSTCTSPQSWTRRRRPPARSIARRQACESGPWRNAPFGP